MERVLAGWFPHLPDQSQYNRRLRGLVELISAVQQRLARWLDAGGARLSEACGQVGRSIRDLRVRAQTGALIVGRRHRDGEYDTTRSPDTRLEDGDVLIVVGTTEELRAVEGLFASREAVVR